MGGLKELTINNIQTTMNKKIARDILDSMFLTGKNIQKIRLSNMNLDDEKVIDTLLEVIHKYDSNI